MKIKKLLLTAIAFIVLILELLPFGAVLNFANPEGENWRRTYSYFSLVPFGYANVGPFLTAIFTCILIILCLVFLFKTNPKLLNFIKIISAIAFLISLTPLLFGLSYISVIGIMISALLLFKFIICFIK